MQRRSHIERHQHAGPPGWVDSLLEARALLELASLPATMPLLWEAPRGDGHPVLLVPGFMASDATLVVLKAFLQQKGYEVHTWGFGRNVGFRSKLATALPQKIRYLHHMSGRKVSLVGWSLGGVFSLYGAQHATECVRDVITLGSPVTIDGEGSRSPALVRALYRLIAYRLGASAHMMQPRAKALRERRRPQVPTSCLYTLSDGVVPPQEATLDSDNPWQENIRVPGSHVGLVYNGVVLAVIAERLAQAEGAWQPFAPTGLLATALDWTVGPASWATYSAA